MFDPNILLDLDIWWWMLLVAFILDDIFLRRRIHKVEESVIDANDLALSQVPAVASLERRMRSLENTTEFIINETGVNVIDHQEEEEGSRSIFFLGDPGGYTIESLMDDRPQPTSDPNSNMG